jgi:hypothetical protein
LVSFQTFPIFTKSHDHKPLFTLHIHHFFPRTELSGGKRTHPVSRGRPASYASIGAGLLWLCSPVLPVHTHFFPDTRGSYYEPLASGKRLKEPAEPVIGKRTTYQAKYKFYEPPIIDTLCTTPVHNFSYIDNTAYITSLFPHSFW